MAIEQDDRIFRHVASQLSDCLVLEELRSAYSPGNGSLLQNAPRSERLHVDTAKQSSQNNRHDEVFRRQIKITNTAKRGAKFILSV